MLHFPYSPMTDFIFGEFTFSMKTEHELIFYTVNFSGAETGLFLENFANTTVPDAPRGRLNIKASSYLYRDIRVKDKTV